MLVLEQGGEGVACQGEGVEGGAEAQVAQLVLLAHTVAEMLDERE